MEEQKKLPINSWDDADKPREKLMHKGKSALSDSELIAILIGSGSANESAVELSQKILNSVDNNLIQLSQLDIKSLMQFKGIGEAKAITIIAAMELSRRRRESEVKTKKSIKSSQDVFELFQPDLADLPHEEFWVLLLARSNRLIRKIQISGGGINASIVDPRVIFKNAVDNLASSIILCHNHPSGNLKPSQSDIDITKKIVNAASFFDISVPDHIIIGIESYYSFADEGMMPIN